MLQIIATCFRKTVIHTSSSNLIIVAHATRATPSRNRDYPFYPYWLAMYIIYDVRRNARFRMLQISRLKFRFLSLFAFCPLVYRDNGLLLFSCGPLHRPSRKFRMPAENAWSNPLALCMHLCLVFFRAARAQFDNRYAKYFQYTIFGIFV